MEASLVGVVNAVTCGLRGHAETGHGPAHVIVTPDGRTAYPATARMPLKLPQMPEEMEGMGH